MGTIWDFGRLFPAAQAGEKEGKKKRYFGEQNELDCYLIAFCS